MKNTFIAITSLILVISCSSKEKYDVASYYNEPQQDSVLASIITHVFIAPPYTLMKDRFKQQHRKFYTSSAVMSKFSIDKFYVNETGMNYFFVLRPGVHPGENRGVGGYFKMNKGYYTLSGFREVFVTPIMPEDEVKSKGAFLFDKMVKGEIDEYLKMQSYVQWPNQGSRYDTLTYEWVLDNK